MPTPLIIYLHGGDWVLGSASTELDTLRLISDNTNSIVISLNYPLSPENSYEDMLESISNISDICMDKNGFMLHGKKYSPKSFGMSGDSAGGHLTIATNIHRIKNNKQQVDIQIPIVPVTDLTDFDTWSYNEFSSNYYLTKDQMIWYRNHFAGSDKIQCKTHSPLYEDENILNKLIRTHIAVADCDVLHEDGVKYYKKIKNLDVDATFQIATGQIHIFPAAPYMWKGAVNSMLEICNKFNEEFNKH